MSGYRKTYRRKGSKSHKSRRGGGGTMFMGSKRNSTKRCRGGRYTPNSFFQPKCANEFFGMAC